jgi:hypothetical protein
MIMESALLSDSNTPVNRSVARDASIRFLLKRLQGGLIVHLRSYPGSKDLFDRLIAGWITEHNRL